MIKNITHASLLSLLLATQSFAEDLAPAKSITPQMSNDLMEQHGPGFASLEHKHLGDMVRIYLPASSNGNGVPKLSLPNGIKLSYGEIVMYAGDMFGNHKYSVSSCKEKDRLHCFKLQFEALAVDNRNKKGCSNPVSQANNLIEYMATIENELAAARQNGMNDWDYYNKEDVAITKKLNILTCGGSAISAFIPAGNYIKLAQVNFDHFAPDSLIAYQTGHRYALETAMESYQKKEAGDIDGANKLLELAYAQNAFANHYLTDSFSAGHMRTPRRDIAREVNLPAALNLLLANLMHGEDNRMGINVVNAEGMSWVAYGDGYLYKPEAELQRGIIIDAMQRSADDIYTVYQTGIIPDVYPEMALFPDYEKINQLSRTAPLFKMEKGVLLKRVNSKNPYDFHWTKYWSGLLTLIEFGGVN